MTIDRKIRHAGSSGAGLAAVLLASSGLFAQAAAPLEQSATPSPASAQRGTGFEKQSGQAAGKFVHKYKSEFKDKGLYSVAGEDAGRIIFQDQRGKLFYLDAATGDQKFVSQDFL